MSDKFCDQLEEISLNIHRGIVFTKDELEVPRLIFCSPQGDIRVLDNDFLINADLQYYSNSAVNDANKTPTNTYTLVEAIKFAGPKTKIQLLPGKYYQPIEIYNEHTSAKKPLIICGMGEKTILCGSNPPDSSYPKLPTINDFAFIKIKNTKGILIKNLSVENCWPCFLFTENCQDITVQNSHFEDARYPIFSAGGKSKNFIIKGNYWKQDTSEAMWQDIDWVYSHHSFYSHFNGGFFGSLNFKSGLEFYDNTIEHAFNGLRMTVNDKKPSNYNLNVQIYRNKFNYIRDNAIEPEKHALNWHIYHNQFFNNHAPFSLDNVSGGHWLIYGNIGWFDQQPGLPYQRGRGGKIFKFNKNATTTKDSYIFNNSWYTRSFVMKKTNINHIDHFNNAYQFCDPKAYSNQPCFCVDRKVFTKDFPEDEGKWPKKLSFDYDICSIKFGVIKTKHDQEEEGIEAKDIAFITPQEGDFRLKDTSPAIAAGKSLATIYKLAWVNGSKQSKQSKLKSKPIDIGAYQGENLISGPGFKKI